MAHPLLLLLLGRLALPALLLPLLLQCVPRLHHHLRLGGLAGLPALWAQHLALPRCEPRSRRIAVAEPATPPPPVAQRAVHFEVESGELSGTEEARCSAAESSICSSAPHRHAASQLTPHPGHLLVGGHARSTRLLQV